MPESPRYEFLERFLANNFALSDVEGNTIAPLNRIGIVDLPLLRTPSAIHKVTRANFLGSDKLLFKACVRYFLSNSYFPPNNSPSKTMKNAFYFT